MRHSAGAWSGKTSEVPPPSHSRRKFWDAVSKTRRRGNCIPFWMPIPGRAFRYGPLAETSSHF